MFFSRTNAVLFMRRLREQVVREVGEIRTELADIRQLLQNARDVVLAVRAEVIAARGTHATVDDRLTAIETRLPPTP